MSDPEPTRIGIVRQVLGSEVIVELDDALAGVSPVFEGSLMPIGQIGSLVRIPQGLVDLIATVTLLGIGAPAEGEGDDPLGGVGKRWLKVQLLGQIDRGTSRFERGVGTYPGLDDPVHFARPTDLSVVFPRPDQSHVRVGRLSASESVLVTLDLGKLVMRHSAVVGSTGSGKTSAVASVLQAVAGGGWDAANIVVIDPHGEYATAFGERASVRSVFGNGPNRLAVPYWALPAADILFAFTGVTAGATTVRDFAGLVTEARKRFAAAAKWLNVEQAAITSDTPIPFDLRWVWHELDYRNRETRRTKADPTSAAVVAQGDPENLVPTTFEPYGPAGQSPHQAPNYDVYGSAPELLRLGIQDPRLAFLLGPEARDEGPDPLEIGLSEWLGGERPVSVLDFSGVPEEAAELAIGVILHLLFETATRTNYGDPGIGRPRPVLVVLEEAHRYLGEGATRMAREAANRIAREGRKYGVGLMLVTQRPSELPDTALAQCGTLLALRLTNSADQSKIRHALPDSVSGLAETLPSLRTGEAIVSGEALVLPVRALIDTPSPGPLAHDPDIGTWRMDAIPPEVSTPLARWRGSYEV